MTRRYTRRMPRLLLVLSCLLVAACAATGTSPRAAPQADTALTVVSANLRLSSAADGDNAWPLRKAGALALLRGLSPEVLGVQEALADQHDAVAAALPGHLEVGGGRDDGKRKGEFSSLFLRQARFELLDSGQFWLSPTPEVPGSMGWDAAYTRICTWARVRDRRNGRELLIANTHFDHRGVLAREQSARLIVARLRDVGARNPDTAAPPILLLGDFNSDEHSNAYRTLRDAGLADAYRSVHPQAAADELTFHDFKGATLGRRIDFIFNSADLRAVDATIDRTPVAPGRFPSDHYFVTARLEWK
ncbi:MAG TPA: endonuclease/exonuclease/phosphatase family protein [Pseudoxanthomonas sp.]